MIKHNQPLQATPDGARERQRYAAVFPIDA